MTTNTLVRGIVDFINNDIIDDSDDCEALLSFDDRVVPAPLTKMYFAFLIGEDKVNIINSDTEDCCQATEITVSMNCYAPPGESAIGVCSYAEDVLERVNAEYAGLMSGYKIGEAVIDDYLKALKIPCEMYFRYEQCPAFNVSDSVIRPFADFLCKTHVVDTAVHLSLEERNWIAEPIVCGTYLGLGRYNEVPVYLGFRPKLVIIFPQDDSAVAMDNVYNTVKCYFDIVFPGAVNSRVRLTSSGFTVSQGESTPVDSSFRVLGEENRIYNYIAFK